MWTLTNVTIKFGKQIRVMQAGLVLTGTYILAVGERTYIVAVGERTNEHT